MAHIKASKVIPSSPNDFISSPSQPVNLAHLRLFLDSVYQFAENNQEATYATMEMSQVPAEVPQGVHSGAFQTFCEGNRTYTLVLEERRPKGWFIKRFLSANHRRRKAIRKSKMK